MNLTHARLFVCLTLGLSSTTAVGQDLLPKGVGLYQYGYRTYAEQINTYGGSGELVPLSSKLTC